MTLTWTKLHEDDGLEARHQRDLASARKKALALGLDRWLYPFQFEDVVRASLKQSLLLTYQMGLGKTRQAIVAADALGFVHLWGLPLRVWSSKQEGSTA